MLSPSMLKSAGVTRRPTLSPERRKDLPERPRRYRANRTGSLMLFPPEASPFVVEREEDDYDDDEDGANLAIHARYRPIRTPSPHVLSKASPPASVIKMKGTRNSVPVANLDIFIENRSQPNNISPVASPSALLARRKTSTAVMLIRKLKIQKKSSPPSDKDSLKVEVHPYSNDPTIAWEMLKIKQPVKAVKPMSLSAPVKVECVRFVCISDTHGARLDHILIPEGDVLLVAGNFTKTGHPSEIKAFDQLVGTLPHRYKIVIAGNHELTFDKNWKPTNSAFGGLEKLFKGPMDDQSTFIRGVLQSALAEENVTDARKLLTNCAYLEDEEVSVYGIRVYGSPWIPLYDNLAFNLPRGQKLLEKWNRIPEGVDVLITQTPALGYGDLCRDGNRAGCVELLTSIRRRVHPKYHVFGHIHEGYGCTTDGYTKFINASTMDIRRQPRNPPIIFDIPLPPGETKRH